MVASQSECKHVGTETEAALSVAKSMEFYKLIVNVIFCYVLYELMLYFSAAVELFRKVYYNISTTHNYDFLFNTQLK